MKDPRKAVLHWALVCRGFNLGDYVHGFPFNITLTDSERDQLQQYIDRCSAMAQCDPLWGEYSSTWSSNVERPVGTDYKTISDHHMRNVCLTFRHLYGNDEPDMTYRRASNLIQQLAPKQLGSEFQQP